MRRFHDELRHKPLDRSLLIHFAQLMADGPVADVGCGPGQVARFLADHGLDAIGIDLSPSLLAFASALNSNVRFLEGSMTELPLETGSLGGITAFYSIIHLDPFDLGTAFTEFSRVLRAGSPLLIAFHVGDEVRHSDEWWGQPVDLDFRFLRRESLLPLLDAAGFRQRAYLERAPYEPHEVATTRGYLLLERDT